MLSRPLLSGIAAASVAAVALGAAGTSVASPAQPRSTMPAPQPVNFERISTFGVYENLPEGMDKATETSAEIAGVSEDGKTVVYSNSPRGTVEFVDITDPANPQPAGLIELAREGEAQAEPTSVYVAGEYLLVAVNTSESYTNPSGRLAVYSMTTRELLTNLDLGGQPDAISVSPDKGYAAIAIENERDEDFTPEGLEEGALPQLPAGHLVTVKLKADPAQWTANTVPFTNEDGSALQMLIDAGITAPTDPEPEYVSINMQNIAAVSLQENNGIVLVDLASNEVTKAFSAGSVTVENVDTKDDDLFDANDTITKEREPDGIAFVDDFHLATANEGDYVGGSRSWSIFDIRTGEVTYDSGNELESLATKHGLHIDSRSDNKGPEPENVAFGEFRGVPYVFVGAERSNFVAVYRIDQGANVTFQQILPTTNGPEGLLPIPQSDVFMAASEVDDAGDGVRSTLSFYQPNEANIDGWPSVVSFDGDNDTPIGWGALSGLAGLRLPNTLAAVSDSAYDEARIYKIKTRKLDGPAEIYDVMTVHNDDGPVAGLDLEGITQVVGGFWLASEGKKGEKNELIRVDTKGAVRERVALPADVANKLGKHGLEGIAYQAGYDRPYIKGDKASQNDVLYFALQRPLKGEDVARIGRYDLETREFAWTGYPLETTDVKKDWIGLSGLEMTHDGRLAVVERDKQNGPDAAVKRVYTIDVDQFVDTCTSWCNLPVVKKELRHDLLPGLTATNGWQQEKTEGFAIDANGREYAVTDNDALDDASGETMFLRLPRQ